MSDSHEEVIEAKSRFWDIDWKGLLQYRALVSALIWRDFSTRYRKTLLGPWWVILHPVLTTLVFTVIFGKLARISTDGIASTLFYFSGFLVWRYFANCFTETARIFHGNANLFSKVYFPRLIIPIATVVFYLLEFVIQLIVFLGLYLYFKFFTSHGLSLHLNGWLWWLPLMMAEVAALAMGAGLWLAALSTKVRDVHHALGFLTQGWFYFSPVVYPLSLASEEWRWVLALNPMAVVIEALRFAFFGIGFVHPGWLLVSALVTALVLASGILAFNKAEYYFLDRF